MKKVLKYLIIFLLLLITVGFTYYLAVMSTLDEIWNYGFSYNISQGLVPYKDFNMVVPPFFSYLVAIPIKMFGNKLIIYHVVIAMLVVGVVWISYKKIGYKSLVIYLLLLIYPYNGYNTFCVFLLFLLLYILDSKSKNMDIWVAIIVGLMVISKQTMFILIIPSIIYSRNRLKTIGIYVVFGLLLLLYLIVNNNFYQFIDYCFLGMFDFADKNNTGFNLFLVIELLVCFVILIVLIKDKFKNRELIYILLFQVLVFPIVDYSHFVLGFCPVVYYIFERNKSILLGYLFFILIFSFFIAFYCSKNYRSYNLLGNYKSDSYLDGRNIPLYFETDFKLIEEYLDKYSDYRLYLLNSEAYLVKLELGLNIDKYDLINNGNMGYNGSYKYIKEIDEYCSNKKCIFVVDSFDLVKDSNQINKNIVRYVDDNYDNIYASSTINIYYNENLEKYSNEKLNFSFYK